MPSDQDPTPPAPGAEPSRSFANGEEDGRQIDTFSRNDREGLPNPAEDVSSQRYGPAARRLAEAGEEDGYATDTFSRNDQEGLPDALELLEGDDRIVTPEADSLRAGDDPESRDATPPSPQSGGVR